MLLLEANNSNVAGFNHAAQVCEKLRAPIAKYTGPAGYSMLLSRALALSKAETSSLDILQVRPDGTLDFGSDVEKSQAILAVEALGDQVPFNCPGCGGVLWEIAKGRSLRFRCHTGHAFTGAVLLAEQTAKIEETLWVALRMLEERRNLLQAMSDKNGRGYSPSAKGRASESEVHIERIRAMLKSDDKATSDVADN